ncbi:hypothetical protein [Haladaptatus halobius]|uniref:hypothetical protein n=1 Tax=Haladaptatus halobius TaxID=2884875 RepID=UPI001D0B84A7|nr:hypothetical protein [Haladaptatus halobius]
MANTDENGWITLENRMTKPLDSLPCRDTARTPLNDTVGCHILHPNRGGADERHISITSREQWPGANTSTPLWVPI